MDLQALTAVTVNIIVLFGCHAVLPDRTVQDVSTECAASIFRLGEFSTRGILFHGSVGTLTI
jgi:hypothetical protein